MTQRLDGNSLAGPLSTLFRFDPTVAMERCNGCGDVRSLAASIVYASEMGTVVRCAMCDGVLMVFVQTPNGTYLSTQGLTWLGITAPQRSS
jgi:hypothetical protein